MKLGIDLSQPSSIRGIAWVFFAIVGALGWWAGKDIEGLIPLAMAVAGGLGVIVKDK